MKYYFQRPPKNEDFRVEYSENLSEQVITFKLFRKAREEDTLDILLDEKSFSIAKIFVKDFYALLPIRNEKFLTPVNMEIHQGKVGATETIQKVYQYDTYACYIIFGSEPIKEKISILGLLDFNKSDSEIRNAKEYLDFYQIIELAVDSPEKIKIDVQKRQTLSTVSVNEILTGMEAQLDLLSKMFLALVQEVEHLKAVPLQLLNDVDVRTFSETLQQTSVLNMKTASSALNEMKTQKEKIRKEQDRYFVERNRIKGNCSKESRG